MKNNNFPAATIRKYSRLPRSLQNLLKRLMGTQPLISVVIVVHNMQRVAPRTLQSFTAAYQGISSDIYEVIVVENGSDRPLSKQQVEAFGPNFRYFSLRGASPSPVGALNFGVKQSRGRMLGLMIDGAHLVTPGVLRYALRALKVHNNPVISILALHLGPQLQRLSIKDGYSEEVEDALLQQIDWPNAAYKLFTISSLLKGTNDGGWFLPMNESNCVFMLRRAYDEIGGFDERFDLPGGGLANLDFYHRVCEHPTAQLIQLLSEATFHQIHGGVATNNADDQAFHDSIRHWMEQYKIIRGKAFRPSVKSPEYWGEVIPEVIPFLNHSIRRVAENTPSVEAITTQVSKEKQEEYLALIRSSGFFDAEWYLANNPDVAQAKMDPFFHYLRFGGFEGRDPGPNFSSNWYLHTYKDVKKAGVNPLVHYLKYGKTEGRKSQPDPVIVHQVGKVGSKTVELSLIKAYQDLGIKIPIYHTHALNDFEIRRRTAMQEQERGQRNPESTLAALEYGEHIRKQIDENPAQHWNLVSLVRDPIARNIAIFFYILSEYIPNWRERYTNGELSLGEVQALFLSMALTYKDLDNWFSRQMKAVPAFGIDVYETSFPHEIGYKIYAGASQASLLLIRLENLNECAGRAMHEFLGLENFTLHNTNVGAEKDYADLYRAFREQPLPLEYVERIYKTQFARHFYSDLELELFTKRWTKNVEIESSALSRARQVKGKDVVLLQNQDADLALIRSSGLFDEAWYLANNPDIVQAKVDPLLHYLQQGAYEGRDPGPSFSSDWYLDTYQDIKKSHINPLVHYLKYGKDEGRKPQSDAQELARYFSQIDLLEKNIQGIHLEPIIVHQMGKVGSKTVELSLLRAYESLGIKVPIYHIHMLNDFDGVRQKVLQERPNPIESLAAIKRSEELRQQINENADLHWNVVTLVRDPVARNVATLFQNLIEFIPDWRQRYTEGKLGVHELQQWLISTSTINEIPNQWFDKQIRQIPAFGVDVYAEPFPKEIGYKIYPGASRARLLLIRLENLNECAERAMHAFLGLENFTLHNTNLADDKEYVNLYRAFKDQPLPVEYVQRIYSTQVARHFYTEAELLVFAKRWTGVDKLELARDS